MWRILLATDGSGDAVAAGRFLAALPLPAGSRIHVICVVDPYIEGLLEQARPGEASWASRVVAEAVQLQERPGVEVTGETPSGEATQGILDAAGEVAADLIVVGSKGLTGLEGFVLGSVARDVTTSAGCPVVIGREPVGDLREVVVANDGSEHARRAAQFAARLPLPPHSRFTVVLVGQSHQPVVPAVALAADMFVETIEAQEREEQAAAHQVVDETRDHLVAAGKQAESVVRVGTPAEEILALAAERNADLIIAGARGSSVLERLLTGSVADCLMTRAHCSVMIVH